MSLSKTQKFIPDKMHLEETGPLGPNFRYRKSQRDQVKPL